MMESTTDQLESVPLNAAYDSTDQRRLRILALALLLAKYALRSTLQTWPLYFIAIVPFLIPVEAGWWIVLFIFPALMVSGYISLIGASEEYRKHVRGKLLLRDNLIRLLLDDAKNLCR